MLYLERLIEVVKDSQHICTLCVHISSFKKTIDKINHYIKDKNDISINELTKYLREQGIDLAIVTKHTINIQKGEAK